MEDVKIHQFSNLDDLYKAQSSGCVLETCAFELLYVFTISAVDMSNDTFGTNSETTSEYFRSAVVLTQLLVQYKVFKREFSLIDAIVTTVRR